MSMIESALPFSGFYNSIWSSELDQCKIQQIEHWMEEDKYSGLEADQLEEALSDHIDYRAACIDVVKAYVSRFEDWINGELDLDIHLEFVEMVSPREYNFTTDRIFVKISRSDLAKLYRKVGRQAVREEAKTHFTSRSGFISFYSPLIEEWGSIREWDYNQVGMIFQAAVDSVDHPEDVDMAIYYGMSEDIYNAWSNNVDWDAVEQDLGELMLIEAGEIELEAGEIEPDARKFPHPTVTDPKRYVAEFTDLNHLKGD